MPDHPVEVSVGSRALAAVCRWLLTRIGERPLGPQDLSDYYELGYDACEYDMTHRPSLRAAPDRDVS